MKIISQRREQARCAYNGVVLEVKKEIPVQLDSVVVGGLRDMGALAAVAFQSVEREIQNSEA